MKKFKTSFKITFLTFIQVLVSSQNGSSLNISIELNNQFNIAYEQTFYIGKTSQEIAMIFDTMSSWIQVPSKNCTNCLETTRFDCNSSKTCEIALDSTSFQEIGLGYIISDDFYLTSSNVLKNQTMFLTIKEFQEFSYGVIGLSLNSILANEPNSLIVSLTNQQLIQKKIFAFALRTNLGSFSSHTSKLMIGGYDSTLNKTEIRYFPLNDKQNWGLNASNISFGSYVISNSKKNINISSASSSIVVNYEDYNLFLNYLQTTNSPCITSEEEIICSCPDGAIEFPNISIYIEDYEFVLEPDYYINEEDSVCYLKIKLSKSKEEWVLGIPFLQKYYTIFDADNLKLGFAEILKEEIEKKVLFNDLACVGVVFLLGTVIGIIIISLIEKYSKLKDLSEGFEIDK